MWERRRLLTMQGEGEGLFVMRDPIEVNYVPEGDDWAVTVKGRGSTLTGTAPGLIAARDRADQLVEKLAPDEKHRTVVHLLNGDAVAFTTAYLTARLARTEPAEKPEPAPEQEKKAEEKPVKTEKKAAEKPAKQQKAMPADPQPKPAAELNGAAPPA